MVLLLLSTGTIPPICILDWDMSHPSNAAGEKLRTSTRSETKLCRPREPETLCGGVKAKQRYGPVIRFSLGTVHWSKLLSKLTAYHDMSIADGAFDIGVALQFLDMTDACAVFQ